METQDNKETPYCPDTYLKILEYENEMLKTFINGSEAGMYVSDYYTGEILFANRKMAEIGGSKVDETELVGQICWEVVNKSHKERCQFCPYKKILSHDGEILEPYTWEKHFKEADVWLKITNRAIRWIDGRLAQMATFHDVTKEKKAQLNAEREHEANALKSSFLSNMSHEIRTPMSAIIGLTEIELRKNPPSDVRMVYNKINTSAKNLLNIINDILDLSKIEAGKMNLLTEEFDMEEVLSNALLTIPSRLEGKQVELVLDLSLDLPRFLVGDKTRLWQILRNQLDNAAKFTAKGHIVLTVDVDKKRSTEKTAYICFMISDTGNGMSEEQLQKVFLPYEQVYDDTRMHYSGTGLGIPISKQICEMMGGNLEIRSKLGQGTAVIFTIPFLRSKNKASEKDEIESAGLTGLRVLAVDDSEVLLGMTGTLLKGYGAEFVAARSGSEALEIIRECKNNGKQFDVVLLDYIMEGLDGVETAKLIRKYLPANAKVFIITAYENLIDTIKLEKFGIDGVIEKPFIPTVFIKKLQDVIAKKQDINLEYSRTHEVFSNTLVLVCEDNDINQDIAASMLGEYGIASIMANNGKEGIDILRSNPSVNLVLMDLHMPVMDGYEATRIIRSESKYDKIPIISLTADAMVETVEKCSQAGINDFISKPIIFEDLYRVLKKWLV